MGCGRGAGGVGHGFVRRDWVGGDEGLETIWGKEATDEDVKVKRGLRLFEGGFHGSLLKIWNDDHVPTNLHACAENGLSDRLRNGMTCTTFVSQPWERLECTRSPLRPISELSGLAWCNFSIARR